MAVRLREIVDRFGGELNGDGDREVSGFVTLQDAGPGNLAFLANPKYRSYLESTKAGCVIVGHGVSVATTASITVADPYLYYARVAQWLSVRDGLAGKDVGATVAASRIPASATIAAGAVLGSDVRIGERVSIGPHCTLGNGCVVGDDCVLNANVSLYPGVRLGKRVIVHSAAVVGADGFGYAREADGAWVKIPQTGTVVVGDDVEIGAGTTIDRGALGDTVIGQGVKLDNQIQVGHNVRIGDHTAMAGCVGIAGSAKIGARCTVGGGAVILGHLEIADDVNISAGTLVAKSITRAGTYTGMVPLLEHREWLHNFSRLRHLDAMAEQIKALERRLAELEKRK